MKNIIAKLITPTLQTIADMIIGRMKSASGDELTKLYELGMMLDIYTDFYLDVELS